MVPKRAQRFDRNLLDQYKLLFDGTFKFQTVSRGSNYFCTSSLIPRSILRVTLFCSLWIRLYDFFLINLFM